MKKLKEQERKETHANINSSNKKKTTLTQAISQVLKQKMNPEEGGNKDV